MCMVCECVSMMCCVSGSCEVVCNDRVWGDSEWHLSLVCARYILVLFLN